MIQQMDRSHGQIGATCHQCAAGHYADGDAVCRPCAAWAVCPGGPLAVATTTACAAGQQPDNDGLSCEPCPAGSATSGEALCAECGSGQEPADSGTHCACTFGHYNSSAVTAGQQFQCLDHDWQTDPSVADGVCMLCGDLECVLCGNGLKILEGWQTLALGSPSNVFRCPLENACLSEDSNCAVGYTGTLCGVCDTGYNQVHRSCKLCTETGTSTAVVFFGLLAVGSALWVWRRLISASSGTAVGQNLLTADNPLHGADEPEVPVLEQNRLSSLLRMLYHPGRIMIGFCQVVVQIGPVLHLDFPGNMQWLLDNLYPLAADLQSLLQIKCLTEFGFYEMWLIRTLVLPALLVGGVLLWYSRERGRMDGAIALERCRGNLFVVVFFIYPGVSNRAFALFNCRRLMADLRVLHEDYSVHCDTVAHLFFQTLAAAVALFFSAGVPVALIVVMLKRARAHNAVTDADRFVARRLAEELELDDRVAIDAIRDVSMGKEYSFLVSAYQPRYFFWEGVDMLRKLSMVGLLVVAGQGSLSQIFFGLCLSVCSLGAQVHFEPYKHKQDNYLKLATEAAIFLTLLVALMIKAAPVGRGANEMLAITTYDVLLVSVFAAVLPAAFFLTVWSKQGQMKQALATGTSGDSTDVEKRRRAIKLFQLGIASGAEVRLLADCIGKLDFMVNQTTHVFISYRVAADAPLAKALYEQLSARVLATTGQKIRVYLDVARLEDGQRWDRGFMGGLAGSMVFVPVVSAGALRPMIGLGTRGEDPDHMLVEWAAALELQQRGRLKAVFPLFAAVTDNFFGEASAAFGGIAGLPDRVPESSLEKVSFHLAETTGDSSTAKLRALMCETGQTVVVGEPSVRQIIATILKYQGCKLSYADSESVELSVSRLHGVVEGCMHRVGAKKEGELGDPVSPGHHLKAFSDGEL